MSVVLDASITMSWCFDDEATNETERVLTLVSNIGAGVPPIWPFEIFNTLAIGERRRRITEFQSHRFLAMLARLPIQVHAMPWEDLSEELLGLSRQFQLSSYDASYLVLAIRTGSPLATQDRRLLEAAQRLGVPLA